MTTWNYETCTLELQESGVAILTFNRPEALNSMNRQMTFDVPDACRIVNTNDDIRVLIITGAGPGWATGGDISVLEAMKNPIHSKETYDLSSSLITSIYEVEKPVIAAVNGPVAGASLAGMMSCDMIVAADTARLAFSFIGIAFCPDSGTSYFLAQKVGYHKALEILWYGKILDMNEALQLGLVNKVVPKDEVMNEAMKMAERLTKQPALTVFYDKKLMRAAFKNDFYEQTELEALYQVLMYTSDDFKEGADAFLKKRKPQFTGRITSPKLNEA